MRRQVEQLFGKAGLLAPARAAYRRMSPRHRRRERDLARAAIDILPYPGATYAASLADHPDESSALVVGYPDLGTAVLQFPLIAALRVCGHRVRVRLYARTPVVEAFYRSLGVQEFVFQEDLVDPGEHPETERLLDEASSAGHLLGLVYRGLSVGKYASSTLLRLTRLSRIDLADEDLRAGARATLSESLHAADAAVRIIAETRPELVCFIDRGYTPEGQLFEAALSSGSNAITLNAAHRGGLLMLKRYRPENRDPHPSSLSDESWARIRTLPWTVAHWRMLHEELAGCYRSGTWYDEVGTQFGKVLMMPDDLRRFLGLGPGRKTAVLFAHMFWDATLFYGEDLFADYEEWFRECLKAAAANDRLDWIIKIHPANIVKDSRDGFGGEHSEVRAIRETLGELPDHMKLLAADAPVSTFSLFEVMDYCLTVRGTVGMEAACFGVPVLTAGTGRYDRLGFTIDHDSRDAYCASLARLERRPPLTEAQTKLARRFAYGVILARPLPLQSASFGYDHDASASMSAKLVLDPSDEIARAPDVAAIAAWLGSGKEDFLVGNALGPAAVPEYVTTGAADGT